MKKITLLFALTILLSNNLYSQSNLQKAQQYLESKGEVCFVFTANSENQIQEIASFLSLGHKINRETLEVEAYGNAETFQQFLAYGLPYAVNQDDNEFNDSSEVNYDILAWDTTWNAYPNYTQYVAKMNYYATTYPSICSLETIGTTVNGRELLMLKISDNVSTNEDEPEFLYTSSMHGNELTGYPLMIRLIDYLLTNYGSDTEVDDIINSTVIYINPLANPDGAYDGGNTNELDASVRANANGQDLNRNYPDNQEIGRINGNSGNTSRLHYDSVGNSYELETIAFMKFEESHNIILSANFHGGTEVMNYAYDNTYTKHADHDYYEHISKEYVANIRSTSAPANYFNIEYDTPENPASPGVTQGAVWYVVYGGRQDYMNYFRHAKEITIEISDTKKVGGSSLPNHWNYNKQAFLDYIKQVNFGFQGTITDESGNPVVAKISISGHDALNSWTSSNKDFGDYYRLIKSGSYNVTYEATGYVTQTVNVSVTDNTKTIQDVVLVATTSKPTTNDVTINKNESASLTATGSGTLNWYANINDATPIYTGSNYTTPILTDDTTYYVEDVIANSNVGETGNTSDGNFFAGGETDRYLIFDNTELVKLKTVEINAEQAGEIEVQLQDGSGNMLDSRVIMIETSGVQDIDLNFIIPIANDLRLVSKEMSNGFNLWRNNSGTNYPYTNESITIKNSNVSTQYYYFFYDWKIEAIKSSKEDVVVTVEDTLSISDNELSGVEVYPNPFNNSINIKLPNQYLSNNIRVELFDTTGRSILKIGDLNSENGLFTLSNINSISRGTYFIKITDNESTNSIVKQIVKQ